MNILKVYTNKADAKSAQEQFVSDSHYMVSSSDSFGKVKLLTGHSIYFRVVNTLEDCYNHAGNCFSWIEYNGWFDGDVKQWLASRVREPS